MREAYLAKRATTMRHFKPDPIWTVEAIHDTPAEYSERMQKLLSVNNKNTRYRENCLDWSIDWAARYGCYVTLSQFEMRNEYVTRTVFNPNNPNPYQREPFIKTRENIWNYPINLLNYWQHPQIAVAEDSPIRAFIDTWSYPQMHEKLNDPAYIKENVQKVLKKEAFL